MIPLLLSLALMGQCPPGTYCPNPATIAPTWQYYQIQIDGRTVVVPAYVGSNGVLYYDSTRVPPAPAPQPETKPAADTSKAPTTGETTTKPAAEPKGDPAPDPAPDTGSKSDAIPISTGTTAEPQNFGLDMEAIREEQAGDEGIIQTNDPNLGMLLANATTTTDAGRLIEPKVVVQVPDLNAPILLLIAGAAVVVLLARRPAK